MSTGDGLVVVGGGPAGLAAARAYRSEGGEGAVTMLAAERHLPYERPPLTKDFLRGESGHGDLSIEDDAWYGQNEVEVRLGTEAVELDPGAREVVTDAGDRIAFATCVLATGSEPARLPVPGAADPGVATVRFVEDSEGLRGHGARVAVVGSGFIGCEAAASLAMRGAEVTLVTMEAMPQSERLGPEVGGRIAAWLEQAGVSLVVGAPVESFERAGAGWVVHAGDGVEVEADTVVQAVGVTPRAELAERAGLAMKDGAVTADASQRTSVADVLVAGDAAFALNSAAGRHLRVEHWGEALNQGAVAGTVAAGREAEWHTAPGFWSTIGEHTLKYVAWGDGYSTVRLDSAPDGSFTAWYGDEQGACVGVLTHERDEDYENGRRLVESGAPLP